MGWIVSLIRPIHKPILFPPIDPVIALDLFAF